jgi:hypothetical protein
VYGKVHIMLSPNFLFMLYYNSWRRPYVATLTIANVKQCKIANSWRLLLDLECESIHSFCASSMQHHRRMHQPNNQPSFPGHANINKNF